MAVNIFSSGNNDFYDIVRDLNLNNNTIHNVRNPENENDVANKKYVDSKSSSSDGWTLDGNALRSADCETRTHFEADYELTIELCQSVTCNACYVQISFCIMF